MLILYRRHKQGCKHYTVTAAGRTNSNARGNNNCRCPIWVDGFLAGGRKRINKSLKTANWTKANEIVRDSEIAGRLMLDGPDAPEEPTGVLVRKACDDFLADLKAQHLAESTMKKYRVLLINHRKPEDVEKYSPSLDEFCGVNGIKFVHQINTPVLVKFRGEWKDAGLSGGKKLERLRSFGRFLFDLEWWPQNFALRIKKPKDDSKPTMPFTHDQVKALLDACCRLPDWHGKLDQENSKRARTFMLLARYSALRMCDVASCAVDRLEGNRLFLYTQKTGVPVYMPLPDFVVAALETCPRKSEKYWFWTGTGTKDTLTGNWRRTFRTICKLAGIVGGHEHQFRDTLAIVALQAGVPIDRVSVLLGHKSVRVTEKHYAPWVLSRQTQVEADVTSVWQNDPIVQMEALRTKRPK
jgi:integrase/recombinase XerD